jgi:hypothetical protein
MCFQFGHLGVSGSALFGLKRNYTKTLSMLPFYNIDSVDSAPSIKAKYLNERNKMRH